MVITDVFRGGQFRGRVLCIGPKRWGESFFRGEAQGCAENLKEDLVKCMRILIHKFSPCGSLWIVI